MNDRFKFRAFSKHSNKMIGSGLCVDFKDGSIYAPLIDEYFGENDYILMQSTGLRDKNGTLVFEKDKCKCEIEDIFNFHSVVGYIEWGETCWMIDFPDHGVSIPMDRLDGMSESIEVIGNEFEDES